MKRFGLWMVLCALVGTGAAAQDYQFTQAYASPLHLNPAMSGYFSPASPVRLAAVYRNQWPGIAASFETIYAAVDMSLVESASKRRRRKGTNFFQTVRPVGAGLVVSSDRAGSVNLRATQVSLQYALEIPLSESRINRSAQGVYLRVGFQGGVAGRDLDYSRLVFEEDLRISGSSETITGQSRWYADLATGALLYTNRLWIGAAVHHLTTPDIANTFEGASPLPRRVTIHTGYEIPLEYTSNRKKLRRSVTPVAMYRLQGEFSQLDVGISSYVHPLVFGVFYRGMPLREVVPGVLNHDALATLLGIQFENFSFAYSYDFTISSLSASTGGAHELSVNYRVPAPKRRSRERRTFPCLHF
ncbi:MAG: type IX secretion system membrane protein PorP/SprF [Catalinimonas sp.]